MTASPDRADRITAITARLTAANLPPLELHRSHWTENGALVDADDPEAVHTPLELLEPSGARVAEVLCNHAPDDEEPAQALAAAITAAELLVHAPADLAFLLGLEQPDQPTPRTYGASVSGKPHLVTVTTWPTDPNQLVLTLCGRLALREIPEPAPEHLCGSCRRLLGHDLRQRSADHRHHQRHLEPVRRQLAAETLRHQQAHLPPDADAPNGQAMPHDNHAEQNALVQGLLLALAITLGKPGDLNAAQRYAAARKHTEQRTSMPPQPVRRGH
ncbi:hypothetical protein AB0B50_40155 [Streptomyces sp. NPDC041068]|uniref:hypothetical protein n=1 Tax=Streptomyces sp. NPDC041068 TaxID=3155130 RepID=UPI0033F50A3F